MQVKHEIKYCGRCSAQFVCKVGDVLACQCSTVSISQNTKDFLLETSYDCLCANCMKQVGKLVFQHPIRKSPIPQLLVEGIHFYKENSFFVFTELYHYLKGKCCGNGCRHCAYGNSKHKSIIKSNELG